VVEAKKKEEECPWKGKEGQGLKRKI